MENQEPKIEGEFSLEDFKEKFKEFVAKYNERADVEANDLLDELEKMLDMVK